jgi:hypothetical protein
MKNRLLVTALTLSQKQAQATRTLAARMASGPNLSSNEGIDDAVWKIAAVAVVAALAAGVLMNLSTAVESAGNHAISELSKVPGFSQ